MYNHLYTLVPLLVLLFSTSLGAENTESLNWIAGQFEVLVADDFVIKESTKTFFLHEASSLQRFQLNFGNALDLPDQIRTGMTGKVAVKSDTSPYSTGSFRESQDLRRGFINENMFEVESVQLDESNYLEKQEIRNDGPRGWAVTGMRRLLMIIVDFQDESVDCDALNISRTIWGDRAPSDQMNEDVWKNTYRIFQFNSGNRMLVTRNLTSTSNSIIPDVIGPYKLSRSIKSERSCAANDWADDAIKMVVADGINVTHYTQLSFVLPDSNFLHSVLCHWNGLAHVGCGFLCRSWISGCTQLGVFAHEFGHNTGFGHSGSNWDMRSPVVEYGDPTGIMSNQWSYNAYKNYSFMFNAVHRIQNGWISSDHIQNLYDAEPPLQSTTLLDSSDHGWLRATYSPYGPRRDYFLPSTAQIFRISAFNLATFTGVHQVLRIYCTESTTVFFVSWISGHDFAFSDRALIHSLPYPGSSQSSIVSSLTLQSHSDQNISTLSETTLFVEPEYRFALRLLQKSSQFMDVQMTWNCQVRQPVVTVLSSKYYNIVDQQLIQTLTISGNANLTDNMDDANDQVIISPSKSYSQFNISFSIANMDSDLCLPANFRPSLSLPSSITSQCQSHDFIMLTPGQKCEFTCEFTFQQLPAAGETSKLVISRNVSFPTSQVLSKSLLLTFTDSRCYKVNPVLQILESNFKVVHVPGAQSTRSFVISVFNADSEACTPRSSLPFLVESKEIGWNATISGVPAHMEPNTTYNVSLDIVVAPTVMIGNSTTFSFKYLNEVSNFKNFSQEPLASLHVQAISDCIRSPPTWSMSNPDVAIYTRTAASAPLRIFNTDPIDSNCSPSIIKIRLDPDETHFVQSTVYPSEFSLKPGQYFDFTYSIITSDYSQTQDIEENRVNSTLYIESEHHATQYLRSNVWTAPTPCVLNGVSTGFDCNNPIVIMSEESKVKIICNFGWRNNDHWFCEKTTFNVSFNATFTAPSPLPNDTIADFESVDEEYRYGQFASEVADPSEMLLSTTTEHDFEILIPGQTSFQRVLFEVNTTGIYEMLHQASPNYQVQLLARVSDSNLNREHFASASFKVNIGRCFYPQITNTPLPIALSPRTGPYTTIEFPVKVHPPQAPNSPPPDPHPTTEPPLPSHSINQYDHHQGPATPVAALEPQDEYELKSFPLVVLPRGITKTVNFTFYYGGNQFCDSLLFEPIIDAMSDAKLKEAKIRYRLGRAAFEPSKNGTVFIWLSPDSASNRDDPSFKLADQELQRGNEAPSLFQSSVSSDPNLSQFQTINITIWIKFLFKDSYHISQPLTFFINISTICSIRPSSLSMPLVGSFKLPGATPPIQGLPYPSSFIFNYGSPSFFQTFVNISNRDSCGCVLPPYRIPFSYNIFFSRAGSVLVPITARIVALFNNTWHSANSSWDGTWPLDALVPVTTPAIIPPMSWMLVNVTFSIPYNLPISAYTMTMYSTTVQYSGVHFAQTQFTFTGAPVPPRPVWDIHATEILSPIGMSVGFDLVWRACERFADCRCPCKYHLYRNGVYIESVNVTYYPYRYTMSQSGVVTTFRIVVEDRNSMQSTNATCGTSITFTPSDSMYSYLFIFIILLIVAAYPALVVLMEYLRHNNLLPLRGPHVEDY